VQVALSFGSQSGRTRSGAKGFSSKEKKQKRKKQEFHTHRLGHLQETGGADLEAVRTRAVLALDRLGHQVLSSEPGGYDLDHWKKSFESLLDDFVEKVGEARVTEEFRAKRKEAEACLVLPPGSAEFDSEIARLLKVEEEANASLEEAKRKAAARLVSLKSEREARLKELKAKKDKVEELKAADQSRGFFTRRLLNTGAATAKAEAEAKEVESKISALDEEIERSRKTRATALAASGDGGSEYVEAERKLNDARDKLVEVESAKRVTLQLAEEREKATQAVAEAISAMRFDGVASSEHQEAGKEEQADAMAP
jgi:chromosome segregation ATPase